MLVDVSVEEKTFICTGWKSQQFYLKSFPLFLSWCNKYNCWQIFISMSKHMERMNQTLSTTVRMKTGTDVLAHSTVK